MLVNRENTHSKMIGTNNRPTHSGHESLLNHFSRAGKKVIVILISGKRYEGYVKAFDRYTISLEIEVEDAKQTLIIFKHAVECFYSLEK